MNDPAAVMARLNDIERDLMNRQLALEASAQAWFLAKREREHQSAREFLLADGTVAERRAISDKATALIGVDHEAAYESLKAVVRVLDTRASIGMAILKAHGRA